MPQSNPELANASLSQGHEPKWQKTRDSKWSQFKVILGREKYLYVLALPGILFFLIFKYLPIWGLALAFKNYSPI